MVYRNVIDEGRITMTESLPAAAVVRVSRGSFDLTRFAEVDAVNTKVSEYLVPAIRRLPGLIHWYAGVSPEGGFAEVETMGACTVTLAGPGTIPYFCEAASTLGADDRIATCCRRSS